MIPGTIPLELHFTEGTQSFTLQAKDRITLSEEFLKELKEFNILAHIHI
jgi:hypothetical protein